MQQKVLDLCSEFDKKRKEGGEEVDDAEVFGKEAERELAQVVPTTSHVVE